MSNWSAVIVVWSGTDEAAEPHRERFEAILQFMIGERGRRVDRAAWHPPCGEVQEESPLGNACESVMVFHANKFRLDDLLRFLATLSWEKPEQVGVLWRDEDMTRYLSSWLDEIPDTLRELIAGDGL